MRIAILAAALAFSAGAAAAEQTATKTSDKASAAQGGRVVYVCDRSADTKRSWTREHGQISFVSADDLAKADAAKESWSAPRCITEAELDRYERAGQALRLERAKASR